MGDFLTGTQAPWWSTYVGIVVGGVIAFITSNVIERRRASHGREAREEERKEHARKEAVQLVAQFDAQVETLRQNYVSDQHRWARKHPEHTDGGDEAATDDWAQEVYDEYAELRIASAENFLATSMSHSAIQMLPATDVVSSANDVMAAVGELRPRNNAITHAGAMEALDEARHVLLSVTKNLFQADTLGVPDEDSLYHQVKQSVQGQRLVVGDPPGLTEIRIPADTQGTILSLTKGQALQHERATQFVAGHFLDQGMSAAVFVLELADETVDYYAIGLPTEGEPVTNVPGSEKRSGVVIDDEEFAGHILTAPEGTLTTFLLSETGEIVQSKIKYVDGSPIGVSPPLILNEWKSWKRKRVMTAVRRLWSRKGNPTTGQGEDAGSD